MGDTMPSQMKSSLKILLSVPMNRRFEQAVTVTNLNDIGLGYLAAACKKSGADVTLLSWNVNLDLAAFQQKLLELRPDIVGLKVFTTLFKESYETLRCIRTTLPGAITIIGGPHPSTSRPEDLFTEFDGLLDFAIAGDGEVGVVALIEKTLVAGGKLLNEALSSVPGLIYRINDEVFKNTPCLDVELDSLAPMDWFLQQPAWFGSNHGIDKASLGVLIMDSRGCSGNCGFCKSSKINGSKPRKRSLKLLYAEIEQLVYEYGVRALVFTGNAFVSDIDYVHELCEWFLAFDTPIKWSCTGAAWERNLRDPALLKLMQRAGCTLIHYGIESGNTEVRKRLMQPISLGECTEIVNLTAKAGIRPACYFMFGFPDETVQEMADTISYAFSVPYYSVAFCICLPLPGTLSYKAVLEQHAIDRIDWSKYSFSNPNLLPCKASLGQVHRKLFEAKLLRKSSLARRLHRLIH